MRRLAIFSVLSILGLGLLLTACSSDDDEDDTGGEPTTAATSDDGDPTAAATSDDGSSSIPGNADVAFTGTLQATWSDDAVATCTSFSGQLNASIAGTIGGETYSLVVTQQTYTPGAYFLPESNGDAATTPGVQIVTPSDASLQWDMGLGVGNGAVSLGGGSGGAPLFLTIDGDLDDVNGGDPVHVVADVTCDVTIG
jgi:hypothetical protein